MVFRFTKLLKKNWVKRQDLKKVGTYKVDKPSRPYKARMYGYKSTRTYFIVISSIKKGGIEPKIPARGRTPSKIYSKYSRNISLQRILENRVKRKYKGCDVKAYYYLTEDGKRIWYEFILHQKNSKSQ